MKVVVVDNEINALDYLVKILSSYEDVVIEKAFADSVEAMVYLLKNPCEMLFLDIEMPIINGIYLAEQIISLYPQTKICFVTAYNDFAVKAFEINAVDYILKPFTKSRISDCIKKMEGSKPNDCTINSLSNSFKYELEIICGYNDEEEIVLINYNEIIYIGMDGRKVLIRTKNNKYAGNKPLNFYEEKLKKSSFFRAHKSYIVNLQKIEKFSPKISYNYDLYFKDIRDTIPLSRSKVKELKDFFDS
ncbi:MAG: LytTR family DNA-binding domain-containing protein [Clostridia bacterium]|nr:LytTR family DNA-binding domain-containing protein [Clostridia bacterium]